MNNIKYYLETLDKKKLIDTYFKIVKNDIFENKKVDLTLEEFEKIYKPSIRDFIDKLLDTEIIADESNKGIVFAYKTYIDDFLVPELDIGLVYENEIKEKKLQTNSYAYEFFPQSEILGFLVSDEKYTQENIYDVVIDILYKSNLFEYNEKIKEEPNNNLKDFKKILKWQDNTDEVQQHLENKMVNMILECNRYLYEKELMLIMNNIFEKEKE